MSIGTKAGKTAGRRPDSEEKDYPVSFPVNASSQNKKLRALLYTFTPVVANPLFEEKDCGISGVGFPLTSQQTHEKKQLPPAGNGRGSDRRLYRQAVRRSQTKQRPGSLRPGQIRQSA